MDESLLRVELLVGEKGIERLQKARVAVVGLGAVGSFAAESLARSGVGYLRLIDCDQVKPSNLNRQIYALHSTIGIPKAEVAAKRIQDIQPTTIVDASVAFFCEEDAATLLPAPLDFIVDAIDSLSAKVSLIRFSVENKIPIITVMGAAGRLDPLQLRCTSLWDVVGCRLSMNIRKRLRRQGVEGEITAIWSQEICVRPAPQALEKAKELYPQEGAFQRGRPREPLPTMVFVPASAGILAASHVVANILKKK